MPQSFAPGAAYGWRARIGLMQPSGIAENNPYEFYQMAPAGCVISITSYGLASPPAELGADALLVGIEQAIRRLEPRRVDAYIQAAVPGTAARGWGFDDQLRDFVSKLTDTPFVTDLGSCIRAMQAIGISRPAMLTAFNESDHGNIQTYVKNAGITLAAARTLRVTPAHYEQLPLLPLETIYRAAKENYRAGSNPDGIWITGAVMPSVGVIQALEDDLGIPVVTSMQAMAWAGLRAAGVIERISGFGRLWQLA